MKPSYHWIVDGSRFIHVNPPQDLIAMQSLFPGSSYKAVSFDDWLKAQR